MKETPLEKEDLDYMKDHHEKESLYFPARDYRDGLRKLGLDSVGIASCFGQKLFPQYLLDSIVDKLHHKRKNFITEEEIKRIGIPDMEISYGLNSDDIYVREIWESIEGYCRNHGLKTDVLERYTFSERIAIVIQHSARARSVE